MAFGEVYVFKKMPKERNAIENYLLQQLDFPFNTTMFKFSQFKLPNNFEEDEAFKSFQNKFHVVL